MFGVLFIVRESNVAYLWVVCVTVLGCKYIDKNIHISPDRQNLVPSPVFLDATLNQTTNAAD